MSAKVAFIYKDGPAKGRITRLKQDIDCKKFPTEFFYGYIQLKKEGMDVHIIDDDDLDLINNQKKFFRAINHFSYYFFGLHLQTLLTLIKHKNLNKLNQFSTLVVTTNLLGLAFSFLKKIGLIKSRIVFIGMGLCDLLDNPVRKWSIRWLLKSVTTIVISKSELNILNNIFGTNCDINYVPFGVDTHFWLTKKNHLEDKKYILSIGNDLNRDYITLISSWKETFPCLKIITSLPVKLNNKKNIELISGDWSNQLLSDTEMLDYIQNAMFVVIPINPTFQPSGQSVCLQSMACSKAVIISSIDGIWDKKLLINNKTVELIPSQNSNYLSKKIEYFLANPDYVEEMGLNANKMLKTNFSIEIMADNLKKYIY